MADEAENEDVVVNKSGDSRVLIMMVLCMAVIVLTPLGVYYAMGTFLNTAAETVANNSSQDYEEIVMEKITVNTQGSRGQHFIQVEITLHVSKKEMVKLFIEPKDAVEGDPKSLKKVFQAKIIDALRMRKMEDIDGSAAQKRKLADDIRRILNHTKMQMQPDVEGQVTRLFFSQYSIQ